MLNIFIVLGVVTMGYAIMRIEKYHKNDVKGIENHHERIGKSSNPDIDLSRIHLNVTGRKDPNKSYIKIANERIASLNLKRKVRKDAVVICEAIITSDHDTITNMTKDVRKNFFEDSAKFALNYFGKDNYVAHALHRDEKTEHLHFAFVPATDDGRLSAKALFTRGTLRMLQDAFYEQVGMKYGLKRGRPVEETKAKHKNANEMRIEAIAKRDEATAQFEQLKQDMAEMQTELQKEQQKVAETQSELKITQTELGEKVLLRDTMDKEIEALNKEKFTLNEQMKDKQATIDSQEKIINAHYSLAEASLINQATAHALALFFQASYSDGKTIKEFLQEIMNEVHSDYRDKYPISAKQTVKPTYDDDYFPSDNDNNSNNHSLDFH